MPVSVFVRFFPRAGEGPRVEQILRAMVPATRSEPGCLRYDLFRVASASPSEPVFCLIEKYADQGAVQAHRETDHYRTYRASVVPLLASAIDVTILEALEERGDQPAGARISGGP
jgi:quinol monooxygenase YgiN